MSRPRFSILKKLLATCATSKTSPNGLKFAIISWYHVYNNILHEELISSTLLFFWCTLIYIYLMSTIGVCGRVCDYLTWSFGSVLVFLKRVRSGRSLVIPESFNGPQEQFRIINFLGFTRKKRSKFRVRYPKIRVIAHP